MCVYWLLSKFYSAFLFSPALPLLHRKRVTCSSRIDLGTGCSETLEQGGLVRSAEERKDSLRETGRMSGVNWMVRGLPGGPVQARGTAYAKAYAK